MSSAKLYSWQRLWLPIGSKYNEDQYGFPNFSSYDILMEQVTSNAKSLTELRNDRCLVLIGDPGIGKSTEIAAIEHDETSITKKYSLRDFAATAELFERVIEDISGNDSEDRLFLYFDGLDEGLLNIIKLNTAFINWLIGLKAKSRSLFDRIYFRITCRSVTWSEISETTTIRLRELFGESDVKILELASLRREDVRLALEENGLSPEEFINLVHDNRLQGFCLDPQSLNPLIKCFQEGRLSKDIRKSELFEEMIKLKCTEFNEEHKVSRKLTPDQRFNLASRIAAFCIISNKTTIWVDEVKESAIDTDLVLNELVRDQFKIEAKTELINSKQDLLEILDTALFSFGDSKSRFSFKHRGELEFLAAWHFDKTEISLSQLTQLMTSPNDHLRSIPQIQEVTIWLATLNSKVFEILQDTEPNLLRLFHIYIINQLFLWLSRRKNARMKKLTAQWKPNLKIGI